jgi:PAS domain S-box-containing protein
VVNPLRFATIREFALYGILAVLMVPAIFAFAGAAVRHLLGHDYWLTWEQWFLGNAVTHLIVTPVLLYWILGGHWRSLTLSVSRWLEAALLTIGIIVTGSFAFDTGSAGLDFAEPRFYAPVPFLFWAAIRFGMLGATGAVAVITFFAVAAALHEQGPFVAQSPSEVALALQHFLILRAAPLYVVAILFEHGKTVENALRESERRFRTMADTAPVLIWMSGADKRCEFFNQGWLDFTGRTLAEESGDGWTKGVHADDLQRCIDTYHAAFDARQAFEMEYRLRRHDGEFRWILDTGIARFAASGEFVGYIGTAVDVTDRRRAEETNRNLAHVSRLAMVGELTALVAHEIRQPLSAILSNADAAELMLKSAQPPLGEIREIVADIRRDDLRAEETVQRIRGLLRKREMHMQSLDLNESIADVLVLVTGDAARRRIQVHKQLDLTLPLVAGDRVYLQQVLLNLIVNAMDAMHDTPQVARQLTVRTKMLESDAIEVAISDHGHGIVAENASTMFESFFTTKEDGMGLGLGIAKSIIESHGGQIWAENNRVGGAPFPFSVPLVRGLVLSDQEPGRSQHVRDSLCAAAGGGRRS